MPRDLDAPLLPLIAAERGSARLQGKEVVATEMLREPRGAPKITQFVDPAQAAELLRAGHSLQAPEPPETHDELVARLRRFLAGISTFSAGQTGVICSHYATLNTLLRLLLDRRDPPAGRWAHFDNAGVTRVDLLAGRHPTTGVLMYSNWTG